MIFIHTADWQLGKPFAGVEDEQKRALLQQARIQAVHRIGKEVRRRNAEFVVVSGDLFDSVTPTNATVSAACRAIGSIGVPVFVIPGNHDHAGPGSIWHQSFFERERDQLAPNLRVLLTSDPVEIAGAVLFPCPLLRRHETTDPTACLRAFTELDHFGSKARIVVAHGSTTHFGEPLRDNEDFTGTTVNVIDLSRLRDEDFDYVALGDWHGTKRITDKAWYAGTPEPDRFSKGNDHAQGHILAVEASRNQTPRVEQISTAETTWKELTFAFREDRGVSELAIEVEIALERGSGKALLGLHLQGSLGVDQSRALDDLLESLRARLIRLKLSDETALAPSMLELEALTTRTVDPLVARVAARLALTISNGGAEALTAQAALRELYLAASEA